MKHHNDKITDRIQLIKIRLELLERTDPNKKHIIDHHINQLTNNLNELAILLLEQHKTICQ